MAKGSRREGRELALKAIYALPKDAHVDVHAHMRLFWDNFRFHGGPLGEAAEEGELPSAATRLFAEELVHGIVGHLDQVDRAIAKYAANWSVERMARVDLSLLRLAGYELLFRPETPVGVIINEAIELGKRYGSQDTPSFLNGILDKIGKVERSAKAGKA